MSFADYGYNIFPYNPYEDDDGLEICGDCVLPKNVYEGDSGKSCYHVIIEHLIDLGSCTENELKDAKKELEKYKSLRLTHEQAEQLRKFGVTLSENEIGGSRALITINLNDSTCNETNIHARNVSGISLFRKPSNCCSARKVIDEDSFRATIIQKDSEIISLKNENAAKETELRELEEQNKDLEMIIDKMKDDIDLLESSSRISQSQIESIVKQKNEEIDISRENSERLGQELQEERQTRLHIEKKIEKLQTLLQEAQTLRKNLTEELNMTKRRVQALECSNASYLAMMKQLQKERDSLDQQNCENENEIEKLLNIINKLEGKYHAIKADLSYARDELVVREQKLSQCRGQLETMEREVGKLIGDLAHCLGADDEELTKDVYARARQLTRGLVDVVKEHEQCRVHRENLIKEIDRQKAINQGYDNGIGGVIEIESANRELAMLKKSVMSSDSSKVELNRVRSDLIVKVDSRRFDRSEQACIRVASEALQALQKLDQTISEHEVYRKCESFLLLELENLQEALNGAEKTISGLDLNMNLKELNVNSPFEELEEKRRKLLEESGNNSIVESLLSKQLLQRVQTSTQIVVRITTALREDSVSKMTYNKKLEEQLQQALAELNEIGVEKCQLENEYNECKNQCRDLDAEVEKLQTVVKEKSQDLQDLGEKMQARLDHFRKENDTLRKQLTIAERRYQDSRSENSSLIKKSDEIIETLRREGQNRDLKLQEYCKLNDYLTSKLEEAKTMLEQQQRAIVQETMRSIDLEGFNSRYDQMLELVREKDELAEKLSIMDSQLANRVRSNDKLQKSLGKIQEENKFLEKCIESVKRDNERMEKSAIKASKIDLGEKCEKLLEKIESIGKFAKPLQKTTSLTSCSEAVIRGLEKEIKSYKEKLRYQQKELLMREKEIIDQTKKIEQLQKAKDEISVGPLLRQIELITREKCQLDEALKQTQIKYEDKLAEMHKQYKQHEVELHKSHTESIRRLEAKYEITREEEIGSQSWLQSLSTSEVQQLHDRICTTPLCPNSTYERDLYEEQRKMSMSSKVSLSSYGSKRPLPAMKKAETRAVKSSSSKPNSRQKILVAEKDVSARSSSRR